MRRCRVRCWSDRSRDTSSAWSEAKLVVSRSGQCSGYTRLTLYRILRYLITEVVRDVVNDHQSCAAAAHVRRRLVWLRSHPETFSIFAHLVVLAARDDIRRYRPLGRPRLVPLRPPIGYLLHGLRNAHDVNDTREFDAFQQGDGLHIDAWLVMSVGITLGLHPCCEHVAKSRCLEAVIGVYDEYFRGRMSAQVPVDGVICQLWWSLMIHVGCRKGGRAQY